jgi:hypothetical protein
VIAGVFTLMVGRIIHAVRRGYFGVCIAGPFKCVAALVPIADFAKRNIAAGTPAKSLEKREENPLC